MPANKLKHRQLRLESLESRLALHGGHDEGPDYPLATGHVHAHLKIFIDGENVSIPANVGAIGSSHVPGAQMQIVHTHDVSGTLHIEPFLLQPPATEYPTLGDFFEIWRTNAASALNNPTATLSATLLMGRQADATHEVRMYVDGRRSFDFENHLLDQGESITLVYTETNAPESVNLLRFATNVGTFDMELYPEVAPITVENFMEYAGFGDYDGTIIHRSVPGFVIQGGGYLPNGQHIQTGPPIQNEFGLSNLVNTVAMAKLGGNPDSATSEWYVNLANNAANLDNQNGGFTVFGRVLTPDAEPQQVNPVVAAIAALPIVNNGGARATQPVLDTTSRTPVIIQSVLPVLGEIHGLVFLDLDRDGQQDIGESGQSGWIVFVDADNDGSRDSGEVSGVTAADGSYTLAEAPPGEHLVRIESQTGYNVVQPITAARTATLYGAETVESQNFGVALAPPAGEIRGRVFYDLRGNGRLDAGDWPLVGWAVYTDGDGDQALDASEAQTLSQADGSFVLRGLAAGSHVVRLQVPPAYSLVSPVSGSRIIPLGPNQIIGRQNFAAQLSAQPCWNADLDHSGDVSRGDVALFVGAFGTAGVANDLDGDDDLDLRDLRRFNAVFGQVCPGSSAAAVVQQNEIRAAGARISADPKSVRRPRMNPLAPAVDHALSRPDVSPSTSELRASRRRLAWRATQTGDLLSIDN